MQKQQQQQPQQLFDRVWLYMLLFWQCKWYFNVVFFSRARWDPSVSSAGQQISEGRRHEQAWRKPEVTQNKSPEGTSQRVS